MRWEYRIVTSHNALTEAALNELGDEGWELVGLTSHREGGEPHAPLVAIVCVFKRERRTRSEVGASSPRDQPP